MQRTNAITTQDRIAELSREYDRMVRDPAYAYWTAVSAAKGRPVGTREDYIARRRAELGI